MPRLCALHPCLGRRQRPAMHTPNRGIHEHKKTTQVSGFDPSLRRSRHQIQSHHASTYWLALSTASRATGVPAHSAVLSPRKRDAEQARRPRANAWTRLARPAHASPTDTSGSPLCGHSHSRRQHFLRHDPARWAASSWTPALPLSSGQLSHSRFVFLIGKIFAPCPRFVRARCRGRSACRRVRC